MTVEINDKVILGGDKFTVLAGPCVIENRDICFKIAENLLNFCSKAGVQYIFKASFDKANRTAVSSFRGHGVKRGLAILAEVREHFQIPVITDIHDPHQVKDVAEIVDILQIPAFLCRQTDLLVEAGKSGKPVNVKKGQFMAPEDMKGAIDKITSTGNEKVALTERGSSFGYHNLVVDMRSLVIMRELGAPVIFDATHSVQLPGGLGNASGGEVKFVRPLARAAASVGIDGLFMEVHPDPAKALCDGANSVDFTGAETIINEVKQIHELTR